MADVALINGVVVPVGVDQAAARRGDFPADGAFVSVVADGGVASGWLVVEPLGRERSECGRTELVGLLRADGVVVFPVVTPEQVEPSAAPGGEAGTWLSARELAVLRAGLSAQHDAATARRQAQTEREARESWLRSLVSDAHEWADENSLCGEFDRFMDEHDLPGREREFEVTVDVTVSARVTVTQRATSADAAREQVSTTEIDEEVRERIRCGQSVDFDVTDWDIDSVDEA